MNQCEPAPEKPRECRGFGHTDRTVGCLIAFRAQSLLECASFMKCVGGQHKKLDPKKVPEGGEQSKGLAVPVSAVLESTKLPMSGAL